ncbi:unnamed protein product [Symbiodinium necroappetens]|uniref:Uncharacterized protein n=1 Tax=Symbiodinium necroappetens TaxID=1628268 RepID=A0A813C8N2_9DINO|nr:unnamed protein product [Symbiodinium necroappetens]
MRGTAPSSFSSQTQFSRKAFAWGNPDAQQKQEAKNGQGGQEESQNRTYEILAKTGTVKAEPHMDAKLKTKKSKGSRFLVSEMTMNGWLKLENEPGWLAAHLRGVQDIGEVAAPLETEPMLELAVPVYQPQGMVCLEVVFKTGVPVREAPNRRAKTVATLKCGEFVFAHTQNFDGWLKLSGKPEGWVLANDSDWGELLRRRRRMNDIDLWALCDAWAADLLKTETWMRQRIFAHVLEKKSKTGEGWLRELISGFKLSSRVPPLPGIQGDQEEDDYYAEQQAQQATSQAFSQGLRQGFMSSKPGGQQGYGAFDPAFEGTKPFEYKGKMYTMAPNGVMFDPPNQIPMGIWNPDTQRLDPAAGMMPGCPYPAISYLGRTYILLPDQRLLDPETEDIVGTFNRETSEIDLQNPTLLQQVGSLKELGSDPTLPNDSEPLDIHEYIERGNQMVKAGRFKAAAGLFSEALNACSSARAVDLDLETDIIKSRAKCWKALGCFQELKDDSSKVLKLTGNRDADALQWHRAAEEGLAYKSRRQALHPREE